MAESSLTGESEPVLKAASTLPAPVPLGDRTNMVFSGSAVTRGRGRAVVTATGMDTEMGRIASLLGRTQEERTPLQREVDLVGRTLGVAVIAIAVVVVAAPVRYPPVATSSSSPMLTRRCPGSGSTSSPGRSTPTRLEILCTLDMR